MNNCIIQTSETSEKSVIRLKHLISYTFCHWFLLQALKELVKLQSARQQLLEDQKVLQTLHEQLNVEYDLLSKEREVLKVNLRDARTEKRNLHDKYQQTKLALTTLEAEKENLLKDSQTLVNLRTEHSKLKVSWQEGHLRLSTGTPETVVFHNEWLK